MFKGVNMKDTEYSFTCSLTTPSVNTGCMASNDLMTVINEFERMGKEMVVAHFEGSTHEFV
jgi:hypothetical protein